MRPEPSRQKHPRHKVVGVEGVEPTRPKTPVSKTGMATVTSHSHKILVAGAGH